MHSSEKADNPKPQIDEQKSFMRKKSPAPMTETQGDVVPSSGAQPLKPEPKSDTLTIPPAVPVKGKHLQYLHDPDVKIPDFSNPKIFANLAIEPFAILSWGSAKDSPLCHLC